VRPTDLLDLLRDFSRDKIDLLRRHEASARQISSYEVNNTYQYVIAREEAHVAWVTDAIQALAGTLPEAAEAAEPKSGRGAPADVAREVAAEDAKLEQAFVDRWRGRVEAVTNARHKVMLRLILGEMLEHTRFFEQAAAGRSDVLGRRPDGAGTGGGVLRTRWVE